VFQDTVFLAGAIVRAPPRRQRIARDDVEGHPDDEDEPLHLPGQRDVRDEELAQAENAAAAATASTTTALSSPLATNSVAASRSSPSRAWLVTMDVQETTYSAGSTAKRVRAAPRRPHAR
jgi:hypothetical protein